MAKTKTYQEKLDQAVAREDIDTINKLLAGRGYQLVAGERITVKNEDDLTLFRSRSVEAAMRRITSNESADDAALQPVESSLPAAKVVGKRTVKDTGTITRGEVGKIDLSQVKPPAPALLELAEQKKDAMTRLMGKSRELKNLELEVAGFEARIAAYLIGLGRNEEAILNLMSEASLLVSADEELEAIEVFKRAIENTTKGHVLGYIRSTLAHLESRLTDRKNEKSLAEVTALLDKMGARIVNTADGAVRAARWVDFAYGSVDFHVEIGTTYRLTSQHDTSGYEVTSLDRLEARIKEAADIAALADRVTAEQDEEDWEESEDDE